LHTNVVVHLTTIPQFRYTQIGVVNYRKLPIPKLSTTTEKQ